MRYRECLDYLYGLQRFGIKLGLDNIRTLLERLGHPDEALRCVHVAGTNGKGSVCATLAAICAAGGVRAGLYTSPHLHDFGERIRVDGAPLSEAEAVALTEEIRAVVGDLPVTFFEFTTAMALLHFARQGCALAILETGMGGRLDATNAVTPLLTVITPVDFDHSEYLGETLAKIAGEKGGIIKTQVPLILGQQPQEAQEVLSVLAQQRLAPLSRFGQEIIVNNGPQGCSVRVENETLGPLLPALAGAHQQENLALAVAAAVALRPHGFPFDEKSIRRGVETVRWPGRLERFSVASGEHLLDGAHNAAGARALAAWLEEHPHKVRWVVGMKGARLPEELLAPLRPHLVALYATAPPVEDAVAPSKIVDVAAKLDLPAQGFIDWREALACARAELDSDELLLVAGSLFLVAAVREVLLQEVGE